MTSSTDPSDAPDPIQPEVPAVKDRQEHGKEPDLAEEVLDHRAEREEQLVREDAGQGAGDDGDPTSFDRDAVPNAEE